jgi:hypothetical protein
MRIPWTPMVQARGSALGVGSKFVRSVTAHCRVGSSRVVMGEKRVSSKALSEYLVSRGISTVRRGFDYLVNA